MLTGGLSSRSVRAVHTILSSALKQAVKWGMLAVNPATACELPRKDRNEMRAMDAEEDARFVKVSLDSIWGLVFRFALETGMRPEEYLALEWRDVDLVDLVKVAATVRRTLCWLRKKPVEVEFAWYWGEGKTVGSLRTIPLSAPLVEDLKRHRGFQSVNAVNYDQKYLAGVNPKIVSEHLGHSSITMTLDVYSHVLPTMQKGRDDRT